MSLPRDVAASLSGGLFGGETAVEVEGRVSRRRWFSSKIFFFDVSIPPAGDAGAGALGGAAYDLVGEPLRLAERVACVYCQGAVHLRGGGCADGRSVLKAADVVELAGEFELGDWVRVTYIKQPPGSTERSVQVRHLQVLHAWAASHPGQEALDIDSSPARREASKPNDRPAPKGELCKFWLNSGRCHLRACSLRHVAENERKEARLAWLQERQRQQEATRRLNAEAIGDHAGAAGAKKEHKKRRADILCSWLVATFGLERLQEGSGVLDVAGGKGLVSRRLEELGVRCTVIDPRQQAHSLSDRWQPQTHEQIAECFGNPYLTAACRDGACCLCNLEGPLHSDTQRRAHCSKIQIKHCGGVSNTVTYWRIALW